MKLQCAKGTGVLFQNEQGFLKDVKCAKYKVPRGWKNFENERGAERRKVREIKFPQYIINEKFEKNKNKVLCFYFRAWLFYLIFQFIFFN